jgi:hypothetical protein
MSQIPNYDHMELARRVGAQFSALEDVVAVFVGGSATSSTTDAQSDLDMYVFAEQGVPLEQRLAIAGAAAGPFMGHQLWIPGDAWTDEQTGIVLDLMYFQKSLFEDEISARLHRYEAMMGYTTCGLETLGNASS